MNPKTLYFLAAGNLPAAIYCERKLNRLSRWKVDESAEAVFGSEIEEQAMEDATGLRPLKTFIPSRHRLGEIIKWIYAASDADLTTCKIGIATAGGGLAAWSYRTRVQRKGDEVVFSGKFTGLPKGHRFSKIVVTMANGDEIGRRALELPVLITDGLDFISAKFAMRFT